MKRWAIFIDVEGFSKVYPEEMMNALKPLVSIMEGIYQVGNLVCAESPDRLFAHQIGDGFIIVSEFAEGSSRFPFALGVFLLRTALLAGGMGKCAISTGDFANIKDCYPKIILNNCDRSGTVRLGRGLMRIFPDMGTALINAYRLSNRESGALLLIDSDFCASLRTETVVTKDASDYLVVDWIHTESIDICEIEEKTKVKHPSAEDLSTLARLYVNKHRVNLPKKWVANTLGLNGL